MREREREGEEGGRGKFSINFSTDIYIYFQSGQSKAGHPVFYFIARKFP